VFCLSDIKDHLDGKRKSLSIIYLKMGRFLEEIKKWNTNMIYEEKSKFF
jgi:hypothetical protein